MVYVTAGKPRRACDKLLEHSFYIGALALIGLMEWYAHLMSAPRMPWAYFALFAVAVACVVRKIRSFARGERRMQRREEPTADLDDGHESGAVRIAGRASRT